VQTGDLTFFIRGYAVAVLLSAAGAWFLYEVLSISSRSSVCPALWIIFSVTAPGVYILGKRLAASHSSSIYSVFSLMMISFRMFFAVLFFVGFAEAQEDFDPMWVWPFFWIYFIFTIFEVWLMMRLSYIKPKS